MTTTTMAPEELAAQVSDVVERLRLGTERFAIAVDGEVVGELAPPTPRATFATVDEMLDAFLAIGPLGEDFADAVREAREAQGLPRTFEWPS